MLTLNVWVKKKKHFSIEHYILSNTSLGNPAPGVFLWDIKNRNGTTDNFSGFWNHDFCQTVVYLETFKKINIKYFFYYCNTHHIANCLKLQ